MANLYLIGEPGNDAEECFMTKLYHRLSGEYEIVTNANLDKAKKPTPVDITNVTHVIFIITPGIYQSEACRTEISQFLKQEGETDHQRFRHLRNLGQRIRRNKSEAVRVIPVTINWDQQKNVLKLDGEQQQKLHRKISEINWIGFRDKPKKDEILSRLNKIELFTSRRLYLRRRRSRILSEFDKTKLFEASYRSLLRAIESDAVPFDAFFSYSRDNEEICTTLRNDLRLAGYRIWLDRDDIPPGSPDWFGEIERGIESANSCVFLISNSWLSSEVCHRELKTAQGFNKRIVTVLLEDFDKAFIGKKVSEREAGWRRFQPTDLSGDAYTDYVISYITEIHQQLKDDSLKSDLVGITPKAVSQSHLTQLTQLIRPPNRSEELTQHTSLLMRAKRYERKEIGAALLGFTEWRRERDWVRKSEKDESAPKPNDAHRKYLNDSRNRLLQSAMAVGVVAISVILLMLFLEAQRQRQVQAVENTALREINTQINNQLQVANHLNRQQSIPIGIDTTRPQSPGRPVYAHNALWISLAATDSVWHVPLSAQLTTVAFPNPGTAIPVGKNPESPVSDGRYLWVSNRGEDTVTRIDPFDLGSPLTIRVGTAPSPPLITDDYVWFASTLDQTLTRIDPQTGATSIINVDMATRRVISGNSYLWVMDTRQILRVDESSGDVTHFTDGITNADSAQFSSGYLWIIRDSALEKFDPVTGILHARFDATLPLSTLLTTSDSIWVMSSANGQIWQLGAEDLEIQLSVIVPESRRIFLEAGRLLVTTPQHIHILDSQTGDTINIVDITNASQVDSVVSDGLILWLTPSGQGVTYAINREDGRFYRRFQLCGDLLPPVFDGSNMWFTCPRQNRLTYLPSFVNFMGIERVTITDFRTVEEQNISQIQRLYERNRQLDSNSHRPVAVGSNLWITQESTGRLTVYDTVEKRGEVIRTFDGTLLPLVETPPYLWTAVSATGEVIRLRPAPPIEAPSSDNPFATEISTRNLARSLFRLVPVSDRLWVLHDDISAGPVITILNQATLDIIAIPEFEEEVVTSGITVIGEDVWLNASGIDSASVYRLDGRTGVILEKFNIPDTDFTSWAPVQVADTLWFSAVVPTPANALFIVMELAAPDSHTAQTMPFYLYPYHTGTNTWGERVQLPGMTGVPAWDGRVFWYSLINGPVLVDSQGGTSSGVFYVDPATGEISTIHRFCHYTDPVTGEEKSGSSSGLNLIGRYVFAGCMAPSSNFAVFDTQTGTMVAVYTDLGTFAWEPIVTGNNVVFTFRDTGTMAIFDLSDGQLQRIIPLGDSPVPPALVNDIIWVYHSGDDTLQRVTAQ